MNDGSSKEGYKTPVKNYPAQDNQQAPQDIVKGANQNDQLTSLQENIPEGGRDAKPEKQAGSPPARDEEINNGRADQANGSKRFFAIPPEAHGYLDYIYAPLAWCAPQIAGFSTELTAANICRGIATGVAAQTLITNARWGLIKFLPYKAHLVMDILVGAGCLAATGLKGVGTNKAARGTFALMGGVALFVAALSFASLSKKR